MNDECKMDFLQEKKPFLRFKDVMTNSKGIFFFVNVLMGFSSPFSILYHLDSLGSVHGSSFRRGEHGRRRGQCGNHGYRSTLIGGAMHPFGRKTKEAMTKSAT